MFRHRFKVATLLLALTATAVGAAPATTHFYGQTACRDIALTFDAETSATTSALVQKLEELDVTATFFLLGQSIDGRNADLVKRIAARHQIGNHSYLHPRFPALTPAQMQTELAKTEAIILNLTGKSTKPYFRPPYGEGIRNATVLQTLGEAGYSQMVHWTVDTNDWQASQTGAGVAAAILNGAQNATRRGQDPIVLMHGFPAKTIEGVAAAVPVLRAEGYQFVTIAELFEPATRAQRDFGGDRYKVQSGDTPTSIAACHNLNPARLLAYNNLQDAQPGMELSIPYQDEVMITLNGQRLFFPVRTRLVDDRTMIHVRFLEHLGAQVGFDEHGTVTVTDERTGKVIRFLPNSDQVVVGGAVETLVHRTVVEQDRLLIPLAFVISQFGLKMDWSSELVQASLTN